MPNYNKYNNYNIINQYSVPNVKICHMLYIVHKSL